MRIFDTIIKAKKYAFACHCNYMHWQLANSHAQKLSATDFALFGGSVGVSMSPGVTLTGGSVGSFSLIKTTGVATLNANLYSDGNYPAF